MAQNSQAYIAAKARALGLDPKAVAAVESMEGGSGRIGDGGHAFGPFQENNAGGVLTGRFPGASEQQLQNWAWSKQGINDALTRMARVASGLQGNSAINAIVSRFERPANPAAEIAGAEAHYGSGGGVNSPLAVIQAMSGTPGSLGSSSAAPGAQNGLNQLLASYLLQSAQSGLSGGISGGDLLSLAMARKALSAAPGGGVGPVTYPPSSDGKGGLGPIRQPKNAGNLFQGDLAGEQGNFLNKVRLAAQAVGATQIRVTSGYRSPQHNAAVGGVPNSNHTTGNAMDGEAYIPGKGWVPLGVALQPVVSKFGLRSGNVPGFFNGGTDPVHVDNGANQRM